MSSKIRKRQSAQIAKTFKGIVKTFKEIVKTFKGTVKTFKGTVKTFKGTVKTFKGTGKKVKEERNIDTERLEPSGEANETYRQGNKKMRKSIFLYMIICLQKRKGLNLAT